MTGDQLLPRIIFLPNGREEKLAVWELETDRLEVELDELFGTLTTINQEEEVMEALHGKKDGSVPSLSLTDLAGVDLVMKKHSLVAAFCKKGLGSAVCVCACVYVCVCVCGVCVRVCYVCVYGVCVRVCCVSVCVKGGGGLWFCIHVMVV